MPGGQWFESVRFAFVIANTLVREAVAFDKSAVIQFGPVAILINQRVLALLKLPNDWSIWR